MLEIGKISKTFNPDTPNQVRALQSVDLSVEEGSCIVVIGTNGSGKSTLLNAVAGTFFVDSGTIRLAGADVPGATARAHVAIWPHSDLTGVADVHLDREGEVSVTVGTLLRVRGSMAAALSASRPPVETPVTPTRCGSTFGSAYTWSSSIR